MMVCDVCYGTENVVTVGLTDWTFILQDSPQTTVGEPCGDLCGECIGLVGAGNWNALDERLQSRP